MKIDEWISVSSRKLAIAGIVTSRLDTLVLLGDLTKKDTTWLLSHSENHLNESIIKRLDVQINRRVQHEPIAYIRKKCEFYGRQFYINKDVLVPRPETEAIIDTLKNIKLARQPTILDIGTGSGCIAISIAKEIIAAKVDLSEIDPKAIKVAKKNIKLHGLNLRVFQGNLLINPDTKYDVIVANLPYVPNDFRVNEATKYEPSIAIYAGEDGLDIYKKLWPCVSSLAHKPSYLITESFPSQHKKLLKLAQSSNYSLCSENDFVQCFILNKFLSQ